MSLPFRSGALILLLAFAAVALSQEARPPALSPAEQETRLPNGKLQHDEILKAEREENIRDAGKLVEMAEELKADLEKSDRFVLPISTLKKTDDIEKMVRKIRGRLRH
jgi:hypothetical protein